MHIMKKLLISLLTCCTLYLQAQIKDCPQTIVDGQTVYVYTVQKSEGLYRISKNFGVSQEEIINLNPILRTSGLKLGQVIYIPVKEQIDSTRYIIHEIQPKETLYSLAKRYGVTVADLQKLNPKIARNMPIGARLLIPRVNKEIPQKPEQPIDNLPTEKPREIINLSTIFGSPDSTSRVSSDSLLIDSVVNSKAVLRIAYLLPFMAEEANRTPALERFLEFYEGALLALYDAQKSGKKIEVYVYDTQKNDVRMHAILQDSTLKKVDAIIGPAYASQVEYISKFSLENKIPTIIPFTSKVHDIENNPYFLQFNPTEQAMVDTLVQYAANTYPEANYLVVQADSLRTAMSTVLMQEKIGKNNFTKIKPNIILNDSLSTFLKPDKDNIIIFNTEKYVQVSELIQKAEDIVDDYRVYIVSHYGWGKEILPIEGFYSSVFNLSKLFDLRLTSYNLKYHHFFTHEISSDSPRYDLLGYDITSWTIQYLLNTDVEKVHYEGLQSDIRFVKINEKGGYQNAEIKVLKQ